MATSHDVVKLHQRGIRKICDMVGQAIGLATRSLADPTKTGGYFCLMDLQTGAILTTTIIGSVTPEKAIRYKWLAEEKALRLFRLHTLSASPHISSYQSKDEKEDKWGGSVLGNRFIYSFSGFPQIIDEIAMLATALNFGDMPLDRAQEIMLISKAQTLTADEARARDAILQITV